MIISFPPLLPNIQLPPLALRKKNNEKEYFQCAFKVTEE